MVPSSGDLLVVNVVGLGCLQEVMGCFFEGEVVAGIPAPHTPIPRRRAPTQIALPLHRRRIRLIELLLLAPAAVRHEGSLQLHQIYVPSPSATAPKCIGSLQRPLRVRTASAAGGVVGGGVEGLVALMVLC